MQKGSALLIGLLIVVGIGLAGGLYYYQSQQARMRDQIMTEQPGLTPTQAAEVEMEGGEPVVVFQAEGAIPESDQEELQARVIDPIIDYYEDLPEGGNILTITAAPNNFETKVTYPYTIDAIFDNGISLGIAIERKADGLAWWYPECMGECPLSDDFRTKYPEIVKALGY